MPENQDDRDTGFHAKRASREHGDIEKQDHPKKHHQRQLCGPAAQGS